MLLTKFYAFFFLCCDVWNILWVEAQTRFGAMYELNFTVLFRFGSVARQQPPYLFSLHIQKYESSPKMNYYLLYLFIFIWTRWRIYDLFQFRPRRFPKIALHPSLGFTSLIGSIKIHNQYINICSFRSRICPLGTLVLIRWSSIVSLEVSLCRTRKKQKMHS